MRKSWQIGAMTAHEDDDDGSALFMPEPSIHIPISNHSAPVRSNTNFHTQPLHLSSVLHSSQQDTTMPHHLTREHYKALAFISTSLCIICAILFNTYHNFFFIAGKTECSTTGSALAIPPYSYILEFTRHVRTFSDFHSFLSPILSSPPNPSVKYYS